MARERVFDELEAVEALLEGEDPEDIREDRSAGVVAALDRIPSFAPAFELDEARRRLDELEGFESLLAAEIDELESGQAGSALREALANIEDLDESLAVAAGGSALSVFELIGVAELCRAAGLVAALLRARAELEAEEQGPGLAALGDRLREVAGVEGGDAPAIAELPGLLATLDKAIDRNPKGGDQPQISDRASEALAKARKQVRASKQALLAKAERSLRRSEIAEALRDNYWTERDGRVVFPIRSDALGGLRRQGAIIHGASGSGHTFFVEPAGLVEDNNALREAELTAAEEERKVLRRLSAKAAERSRMLRGMQRACVALDMIAARHGLGERFAAVRPELVDLGQVQGEPEAGEKQAGEGEGARPAIDLRAARHPLMILDGVDVVPNDIVLERGHGLVISGPNAGGKTVALKTLGLCALMAAAGLRVPCSAEAQPRLPLFTRLITDVGDDQSITANLSTFSAHVSHVMQALAAADQAGRETLVLLDEVAVGTDPKQGAALAEAILIALIEAGATVVATTHYDRLKLLATREQGRGAGRFHNAAVGFDIERMRPTFRLSLGVPGSSSAIAVARRLGMPVGVLEHAEELLGDEGVKIDQLLRDIEAERAALARTRERLERDKLRVRQRDREIRGRERRVLEGVRSRKAKAYAAATDELRALERELKQRRKQLRRAAPERVEELPTRAEISADARAALAEHRAEEERTVEAERGPEERVDAEALAVGDKVLVLTMDQPGEILSLSGDPPKKVTVQLPLLRVTVKPKELAPIREPKRKAKPKRQAGEPVLDFRAAVADQAASHFGDSPAAIKVSADNVCDLRGERYADAQERVADFVAEALALDQDVILIRHGHGGGALRKAVREQLDRLANVRRFRPGLPQEGGDAVTVAWVE